MNSKAYASEREMYPDVRSWLQNHLATRLRRAEVEVFDTHSEALNRTIRARGLERYFDDSWPSFEIKVDVVGLAMTERGPSVYFVECKTTRISLMDLAQLVGYCRVARPTGAFLISPLGVGGAIRTLAQSHDRTDIFEYHWQNRVAPRRIITATWDRTIKAIDISTALPGGKL